jgi:hypothetical protein
VAYGVVPGRKGWYWTSGGKVPLGDARKAPPAVPEGPPSLTLSIASAGPPVGGTDPFFASPR